MQDKLVGGWEYDASVFNVCHPYPHASRAVAASSWCHLAVFCQLLYHCDCTALGTANGLLQHGGPQWLQQHSLRQRLTRVSIVQRFNEALGFDMNERHEPTPQGFARFVRALAKSGVEDKRSTNPHARLATLVAGGDVWQYEYFLKLQDLPQWLPCLAQVCSSPLPGGTERTTWDLGSSSCAPCEAVLQVACALRCAA